MRKLFLSVLLYASVSLPAQPALNKGLAKKKATLVQYTIDTLKQAHGEFQIEFKNKKLKPSEIEKLKKIDAQIKILNEILAKELAN